MLQLEGAEQRCRRQPPIDPAAKRPHESLPATRRPHDRAGEAVGVVDVPGARRREVAVLGEVRALGELHAADQLGNQEVEVGVAVAVAVRRHVHRHAGHRGGEVGAVIEVEPAQVVLVGLAFAAVLADDHARDGLEHLGRAHHRTGVELAGGDRALAGRLGDPDQVLGRPLDVGEVGERGLAGDGDVGGERQREHGVAAHGRPRAARRPRAGPRRSSPAGTPAGPARAARRRSGMCREHRCRSAARRHRGGQLDHHAGQPRARLVADRAGHLGRLRRGVRPRATMASTAPTAAQSARAYAPPRLAHVGHPPVASAGQSTQATAPADVGGNCRRTTVPGPCPWSAVLDAYCRHELAGQGRAVQLQLRAVPEGQAHHLVGRAQPGRAAQPALDAEGRPRLLLPHRRREGGGRHRQGRRRAGAGPRRRRPASSTWWSWPATRRCPPRSPSRPSRPTPASPTSPWCALRGCR